MSGVEVDAAGSVPRDLQPGPTSQLSQVHAPAPHLVLVDDREARARWLAGRPALLRVCAGEALILGEDDLRLFELIDSVGDEELLLDPDTAPGEYTLAEVIVDFLSNHHGLDRHAGGRRVRAVAAAAQRYLLPYAVETAHESPSRRGVAGLRGYDLRPLPRILAGDRRWPAATVAGEVLRRPAVECLWLSLADASRVCRKGELRAAVAAGAVQVQPDARTGAEVVSALDLRKAGLLVERAEPHGLEASTARNVLRPLERALEYARVNGANLQGTFRVKALKPLEMNKMPRRERVEHIASLTDTPPLMMATVRDLCADLPVVAQLVLWLMRLTGLRISEVYGLHIDDFGRDGLGRPFLVVAKQGGVITDERDPKTGHFIRSEEKSHTKTPAGTRRLHIVEPLAVLIETAIAVFHTDATGARLENPRLVPGIGKDDASGQSTVRRYLDLAAEKNGVDLHPHLCRAAVVTDLLRRGVDERVRFAYLGHENPRATIQDTRYDLGVTFEEQKPVLDVLDLELLTQLGDGRVPRVGGAVVRLWMPTLGA